MSSASPPSSSFPVPGSASGAVAAAAAVGMTNFFAGLLEGGQSDFKQRIFTAASSMRSPPKIQHLSYGTAGFRTRYDLPMDYIFFRMALLAVLRSLSVGCKCVGIVITASHNPECDNGIKLVDADGGMLAQSWEKYAELLVNVDSTDALIQAIASVIQSESISAASPQSKGVVIIGRDCRPHSEGFAGCVERGVASMNGFMYNLGQVTTPQLHFVVKQLNENSSEFPLVSVDLSTAMGSYFDTIVGGYVKLLESSAHNLDSRISQIIVDTAGGVGGLAYRELNRYLSSSGSPVLSCDLRNTVGSCEVNMNCGAEYAQKGQMPPRDINHTDKGLFCSIDGDADRIVFHLFNDAGKWQLIDGDKIATLITIFLFDELNQSGLSADFTLGVVQTAYANGASSLFMREKGVPLVMAKTGVKYLHQKAHEYDIGIYFEANGHGTVLFSHRFIESSKGWSRPQNNQSESYRQDLAKYRLKLTIDTINQAVGDALSDMLICLAILELRGISYNDWNAFYSDFPSKQCKIPVSPVFKAQLKCTDDETRITTPKVLQDVLDSIMADTAESKGRCFVRPSGTEDVVRVYAEASTQEVADQVAERCKIAITSLL